MYNRSKTVYQRRMNLLHNVKRILKDTYKVKIKETDCIIDKMKIGAEYFVLLQQIRKRIFNVERSIQL